MTEQSELLNIKQLAARLGVPLRTMHYWLCVGRCPIPHIDGTKPAKWLKSDVEAFLVTRAGGNK